MAECLDILVSKEVGLYDNQWPSRFAYPLLLRCKRHSLACMSKNPFRLLKYSKEDIISMIILSTKSCEKIIRHIDIDEVVSFARLVQIPLPQGQVLSTEVRLSCLMFLVQFHLANPPEQLLPDELRHQERERRKKRINESQKGGPFKITKHA